MPRLHYSERSRADVDTFWEYIAADRPRFAAAVLEHLHEKIKRLRTQPLVGHRHHELQHDVRCLNCDGYLILYRYSANLVRVDRIIHHSLNLSEPEGLDLTL